MWWIVAFGVVVVALLFQISQRLRPIASFFAQKADERATKEQGIESRRWRDWY
jgi:hypothetical protein